MKFSYIYVVLIFCLLGNTTAIAQSMLEQYFGGNKDSLIKEAIKLINTPEPSFKPSSQSTELAREATADTVFEPVYKSKSRYFTVRDNTRIFAYRFPNRSENTVILMHGVASNAGMYNETAGLLRQATQAEVFAIDLRGHGKSDGYNGDVEYIDQYVDDLADIIQEIRNEKPNGKIIIAGHSMGGGVALRYAMANQYEQPDGFLLFAPLLGHNSPAIQQERSEQRADVFMKIHLERIIGLKMLNEVNIHDYDSLPVLFFDQPTAVLLNKYTYRANESMAPDDYVTGLKAVKAPMLVLVGSNDEAFSAKVLQQAVLENSFGSVYIIENATHNGIIRNQQSFNFIKDWFCKLK